ncbi:WxL protein peptidoglycan domain-containing protein [Streptomyces sp. NPDC060000]|uniref:WxL protein peptidoglycan domain-containing protein n=1 Tax=Streptomyces sp. NPDC060000 TaxID=3347031 RepID=UPI0036BC8E3D
MRKPYVLLLPLLPLLLFLTLAAPAHAADNGSWSVYPVSSAVAARPYFYVSADPGQTIEDKVVVANKTDEPLTFRLYAADAYNTARDGGFAVKSLGEKMRGVGAWAELPKDRVTVPGGRTVTVPFTVRVPEGAEPGDHPGAIVALDERVPKGEGGVALGIQRAVGARVYLQVGGPTLPALAVENVQVSHHQPLIPGLGGSTATISYTLHNTGNVTLAPKVRLTASGLFGRTLLTRDLTKIPSQLLPGQRVRLTERWTDAPQLDWTDVKLTASAKDTSESAKASFVAVPWLVVGLLTAGIATGVWLVIRRRRARLRGARGTARPAPAHPQTKIGQPAGG